MGRRAHTGESWSHTHTHTEGERHGNACMIPPTMTDNQGDTLVGTLLSLTRSLARCFQETRSLARMQAEYMWALCMCVRACMSVCVYVCVCVQRAACDAYGIVIFVVTSDAQNW